MQVSEININNNKTSFGAKIVSIRKNNVLNSQQLQALSYVIKHRRGYQHDLNNKFSTDAINSLKTVGFINSGHTLKYKTYSVTNLADQYYKDIYGTSVYYMHRLLGFLGRIFK